MLQLTNASPFQAGIDVFPDERGVDTLYVTVKATFDLYPALSIAETQVPILVGDTYLGEPNQSSVKYPGDRHLMKPATDVILVGQAHAPGGKPVTHLDVLVSVGQLKKVVRVIGDRFWRAGLLYAQVTSAEPFLSLPLVYERAFGGVHKLGPKEGQSLFEPRNPVGRGFCGKRRLAELDKAPLPNLEDPAKSYLDARDRSVPACFGSIAAAWTPRRDYVGTYDEAWRKRRAPYLPKDFDARFLNVAPAELIAPGYLRGGEPVRVLNASPDGALACSLPTCEFAIRVYVASEEVELRPNLETVLIEPDERRLCMTWRAMMPCDKKMTRIQQVVVQLRALKLNAGGSS